MKIIWVSANLFGYELLKEVMTLKGCTVAGLFTLSPQSNVVMYDGIPRRKWNQLDVKVYETENLNNEKDLIKKLKPVLIVVCGWRQIIDQTILRYPPRGTVGFHPTLLPFGRGPAPIINTILRGEKESGLTMFHLTEGLDDGDIIAQQRFPVDDNDHAGDIYKKIIQVGKHMVRVEVPRLLKGKAARVPQNHSKAVIFEKPNLKSNRIDPNRESPDDIYKKIKALSKPYKGAYIEKNNQRLVIWRAELQSINNET